jgi:ribosomal protein S14
MEQQSKFQHKKSKLHKMSYKYRSKNFCLFSGKGSTFNRDLFVSRQVLRKLTRYGLVSGITN